MRKNLLILIISLSVFTCLSANPPSWAWLQRTEGSGSCRIYGIQSDSQNRINVVGYFEGEAILGTDTFNSIGIRDAFVAQLDANGNWLWVTAIAGAGSEYASEIAVDSQDNIYVAGIFTQDFSIGTTNLTTNGNSDIYCAKFCSSGEVLNAFSVGCVSQDQLEGLAVTSQGAVFLSGTYLHSITIGTTDLTSSAYGLFISKWDNQFNHVWAQQPSSSSNSPDCSSLGTDSEGNCYIAGNFTLQCAFGSPNPVSLTSQDTSGYVVKLNSNGNGVWAERISNGGLGIMNSYIDSSGNTYVTCDMLFSPFHRVSGERIDTYPLCGKLGSNQVWQWYEDYSAMQYCAFNKICGDSEGNCYITGTLWGSFSFGSYTLTGYFNNENIYVAKANEAGQWQWGLQTYESGYLFYLGIYDITALADGSCVIAGFNSSETLLFGDFLISPSTNAYAFLLRIDGATSGAADEDIEVVPLEITIHPNPFTNQVQFQFNPKQPITASATVYNLKGQVVKRFPQADYQGKSQLIWNGLDESDRQTASGIYILHLHTDQGVISKAFTRF